MLFSVSLSLAHASLFMNIQSSNPPKPNESNVSYFVQLGSLALFALLILSSPIIPTPPTCPKPPIPISPISLICLICLISPICPPTPPMPPPPPSIIMCSPSILSTIPKNFAPCRKNPLKSLARCAEVRTFASAFREQRPGAAKEKSSLKGLKTRDREYMEHSGTATPRANGASA